MDKEAAVKDLVAAHVAIKDERMETAIWINQKDGAIWLVELLPTFADDPDANEPTTFSASKHGFDLRLVAANEDSLKQAIKKDPDLAKAIVAGAVLHGEPKGKEVQAFAKMSLEQRTGLA